jgi:hypothetical protein
LLLKFRLSDCEQQQQTTPARTAVMELTKPAKHRVKAVLVGSVVPPLEAVLSGAFNTPPFDICRFVQRLHCDTVVFAGLSSLMLLSFKLEVRFL